MRLKAKGRERAAERDELYPKFQTWAVGLERSLSPFQLSKSPPHSRAQALRA